ncbi:hypothetical protein PTKIN_Ptkin12aG0191400 [Pterospermum kingtungense]
MEFSTASCHGVELPRASLSSKQIELLSKIDGFRYATPDEDLVLHTTRTPHFLGLEISKGLWSDSDLKSDVIIGVVDTGIWPEHPSFQDHGLSPVPKRWKGACMEGENFTSSNCNRKLIGARFFFKGHEARYGKKINGKKYFKSARDENGHGTHTASTAAGNLVGNASIFGLANGTAAGVRYASRIAVYKACWKHCVATDVLAAMEAAILDGVDVLSISIGPKKPLDYYQDLKAIASFQAIANGIFVSFSAGNNGPKKSTVTNAAPWIMTVGASSIDRSFPAIVKIGNGETFIGASLYVGKRTKQLPLVYGNTASGKGAEYCVDDSLDPELVQGKIVLCELGKNTKRERKGENVKNAGGAAMLLLNSEKRGEELKAYVHVLPVSSLGYKASQAIKNYMNSTENPIASIAFNGTVYGERAPVMAAFSGRGPNKVGLDLIKPDVTAPGMNILAAWPRLTSPTRLKSDNRSVLFNVDSGTSMSCPHVSGIAALLKSRHRDWSPAAIKSALMTTAYVTDNRGKPILDTAYSTSDATPFAFGSGHVDPERASDPGLIYDITPEDYLYYLCSLEYEDYQIYLFAHNFTCPKHATMQPGDLNYPSFAVNFDKRAENIRVTYKRTVTNVGPPKSTYKVVVEEPKGVSVIVEPESLAFEKLGEKLSYNVSFTGLKRTKPIAASSFGSLVWEYGKYSVRSPIVASWK